jgi:hypothetical protein
MLVFIRQDDTTGRHGLPRCARNDGVNRLTLRDAAQHQHQGFAVSGAGTLL